MHHLVLVLDCFNHSPWTSAKHLTTSPLTVQEVLHNWQRVERQEEVFTTTWWWETWTKKDGKACPNIPKPIQLNAGKYTYYMGWYRSYAIHGTNSLFAFFFWNHKKTSIYVGKDSSHRDRLWVVLGDAYWWKKACTNWDAIGPMSKPEYSGCWLVQDFFHQQ